MFDELSTSSQPYDISLRFCAKCLKKFCPDTEQINSDTVKFFVPTLDGLFRNHFAYIELPKKMVDKIFHIEEHTSVDLSEIAKVLHVELGDLPSCEREKEIKSFYSYSSEINFHFAEQLKI
ncbi:hypothetical protein Lsai_0535 [Legionella sainthelensi]|uniref:Uncharacterized protein n=1 Tax=Legionella sainthelensi TaxID=28087 RepID=A0A0W0YRU9_9GAMM|nr:hypothetical protein [Legionella sainthelensi]KTD59624.1 hypothetical protein Lsai_0535 [Legionella sainthelensi]